MKCSVDDTYSDKVDIKRVVAPLSTILRGSESQGTF